MVCCDDKDGNGDDKHNQDNCHKNGTDGDPHDRDEQGDPHQLSKSAAQNSGDAVLLPVVRDVQEFKGGPTHLNELLSSRSF